MEFNNFLWLVGGVFIGWLTKIPWFLKSYRAWENERDAIRKWMKSHDC